jgi:N-methylhydantoinase A/oxoprolinase/acetone carboxylase beta subunit
MSAAEPTTVAVGVDIGGTFTDVVCTMPDGATRLLKIPTVTGNQTGDVRTAIEHVLEEWRIAAPRIVRFVHGTTVATNAVIERRGARSGLLTTEGFKDVLEMGRQNRHDLYDLDLRPSGPTFLVPARRSKGVVERIAADGTVVVPLDEGSLRQAIGELLEDEVAAIAVSFLFSFLNPSHERRAREVIREMAPDVDVSLSCEVDPAFREYERTCATAFDAYVKPVLRHYLLDIGHDLDRSGIGAPFQVMQSRGGVALAETAIERPIRMFLSGPAAGVIAGRAVGLANGFDDLIAVDIGGTSCDIALIDRGHVNIRSEGLIDGYRVRIPMVDVNAIGAGGGSIAWLDGAGGLRVGPHSAGADPGPACYDRGGDDPTVTDASIVLGYIDPQQFAGGTMTLSLERAQRAVRERIAAPLGLSVEAAALGIHRVVTAAMAEGIRLVSVKRGIDPRAFTLVAFGGAGPLHAIALADELDIDRVLVPIHPGVLSAQGLLDAPVEHEASMGFQCPLAEMDPAALRAALADLDRRCADLMERERTTEEIEIRRSADLCYVGQSFYLEVPIADDGAGGAEQLYRDFVAAHDRIYGHAMQGPVRLANLRTVHRSVVDRWRPIATALPLEDAPVEKPPRAIAVAGHPEVVVAGCWNRLALGVGQTVVGPAILEQTDTTILITPGWRARVGPTGDLVVTRTEADCP